jgi:cystathionine beta-lyase/cystathionine gamma-synthase
MNINEILTHLGENRLDYYNAIAPPVISSSNFVFSSVEQMRDALADEISHHIYTRGNNPTVEILRKKLAALENAEDSLITGSGAAAIATAVLAMVRANDHVICVEKPYSWTYKLFTEHLAGFGVKTDFVRSNDTEQLLQLIRPETTLLFLESPNSITYELQDLESWSAIARKHGIMTIIDNSHASPIFQKPINFGIDLVVHSVTKYLNGHSDVVAGAICGSNVLIRKIFERTYMTLGTIISPHDAFQIIRGLRTLDLRVRKSDESATKIADFLFNHPKVEKMLFPLHPSFPQYELAKKQMTGCGGLITIKLKTNSKEGVMQFVRRLERFMIAVSWGGYESLVLPSIVFHDVPGRLDSSIHWTWVRLYVGIEDADYLLSDLEAALNSMTS